MQFLTIKKRAGKILNILDSSEDFLTTRDVTETHLGQYVNDAYREDAFPSLASRYPHYFERIANVPSYTSTTTVSSSSTSTTLVVDDSTFAVSTIGQYVYNSTDEEYAKIDAYTSATTVTLDTTIDDDWDGDTLYLLDRDFVLGGNATDAYILKWVKVRYSSSDDYVRCKERYEDDIIQTNREVISEASPIYWMTTVTVSSVPKTALTIRPLLQDTVDSYAIRVKYVEIPAEMSSDTDVPRLPLGHHEFLAWKAVEKAAYLRKEYSLADRARRNYNDGKEEMLANFRPYSDDGAKTIRLSRRSGLMNNRAI